MWNGHPFGGWIGLGIFAFQQDSFSASCGLRVRDRLCGKQCLRIWVKRTAVNIIGFSDLYHVSQIHDTDPVADMLYHAKIVCDKEIADDLFFSEYPPKG